MSVFTRDEAVAKVGKQIQLHDDGDETGDRRMSFSKEIHTGTIGRVIHTNFDCRFVDPDHEPADFYEVVIGWELPERPVSMLDKMTYELFITELA
jgi:hypothetical protein